MAKAKREAHRPLKYGEETTVLNFRVPKSKVEFIKKLVRKALKAFEIRKPKH